MLNTRLGVIKDKNMSLALRMFLQFLALLFKSSLALILASYIM